MRKSKQPRLEDIIPDEKYRKKIEQGLLEGKELIGSDGVFKELLQSIVNAALEGEMDHHIEGEKLKGERNRRNGRDKKHVKTKAGTIEVSPPRDRNSTFEPMTVGKRSRTLNTGLDNAIVSLYSKGNSTDDIHRLLQELYGVECSTTAISAITERVWPEIVEWQSRPLKPCYVLLYLDGMHFRVKQDGQFKDRCVYSVYAIDEEGNRDVLGIYQSDNESAAEWGLVLEDLKRRGVEDILLVSIDGLSGFKQAIGRVFPKTIVQRCIVHKVRNSVRFVPHKDKKRICSDLRKVYNSASRNQAKSVLETFRVKWGRHGKRIADSWEKDWEELMPFMEFTENIRRMLYTTNPVEALHRIIRKITKSKGAWVSEKALTKQIYLALVNNEKSWKKKAGHFKSIQLELVEKFGDRYERWLK